MSFDLQSIKSGVTHRPPRIVLLGVEKIGKSTFATGADNPIVLPIKQEEGVDDLDCDKFDTAQTFDDVLKAVGTLVTEQHDYKTFIIDSASTLEPLIWKHLCDAANCDSIEKVGGGYGKGYTEAANTWRTLMEGLDALRNKGMAVILIGHVKVKRFDDPLGDSYDQYQFDVHEKVSNSLFRWSDCILFANTKTAVKKEDVGFNKEKASYSRKRLRGIPAAVEASMASCHMNCRSTGNHSLKRSVRPRNQTITIRKEINNMPERKIKLNGTNFILGKKYRDNKLGNEGIATAGISYLTGCDQIQLEWNDSTGRPVETWIHVTDIESVKVKPRDGGRAPCLNNLQSKGNK